MGLNPGYHLKSFLLNQSGSDLVECTVVKNLYFLKFIPIKGVYQEIQGLNPLKRYIP